DKVLDPACGTGGFLVSAFDKVKSEVDKEELEKFKTEGIYGIEQDPEVVALALVNMIFRGDGRANLEEGNCFTSKKFIDLKVSKVLMNPPFALKKSDEKEYKFIDFALNKMEKGGYLFAVIPSSVMFRSKNFKDWRVKMLENNTLKAVIKLPDALFYPVSVCTSAIIIQKGVKHDKNANVLWGWLKDGFVKKKGVMINSQKNNNIEEIRNALASHLNSIKLGQSKQQFIQKPIDFDKYLECSPEAYLEDKDYSKDEIEAQAKIVLQNLISFKLCSQ
ncbi:N-6 DNA methylase, partial [Reticulomyxa filosa]